MTGIKSDFPPETRKLHKICKIHMVQWMSAGENLRWPLKLLQASTWRNLPVCKTRKGKTNSKGGPLTWGNRGELIEAKRNTTGKVYYWRQNMCKNVPNIPTGNHSNQLLNTKSCFHLVKLQKKPNKELQQSCELNN